MHATLVSPLRRTLATLGLAAALGLAGCQDMTTFVTGEKFPKPPEGSPRIEVELTVDVDEAVWGDLTAHGDLEQDIAAQIAGDADLGMRFYPVLDGEYGDDDVRPDYLLAVRVTELTVATDHRRVEKKDEPPRVESKVKTLDCVATAVVQRRRESGPALVVANAEGKGHVYAVSQSRIEELAVEGQPTFEVFKTDPSHQDLRVCRSDVLQAVDRAVVDALRGVIKGIDRELGLDRPADSK
ncbi:MAG TPA: hypothetical protein VMT18_09485 [Planctomycetota bacterium]|nr:hypothetical protein [Planctomycetota bacterium]